MHLIERLRRDHQRVRDNIGLQLREWSSAVVASAVFGGVIAVCWAAIALMVTGAAATDVVQGLGRAVGYFLLTWSAAVALFVVRGLVIGLSDNIAMAEERAKRWTLAAAGVAMTVLVFLVISSPAAAADLMPSSKPADGPPDYCARDLGTWFYCVRPEAPPEETEQVAKPEASSEAKEVAEFEKFKVELDRVQKLAVWNPTPENVERFYRMQRAALNQSSLFSDQYRRLVWARPDLDYTLKRPVSELGKRQWSDQRSTDRELFLRKISGDIGLFYVYRGTCGPCRVFSPIMKSFADRYAVTVKGISTDGAPNDYISQTVMDRGQLRAWGFDNPTTPSILIYQNSSLDPRTGQVRQVSVRLGDDRVVKVAPCLKPQGCLSYLGAGVMAQDDIAERIYVLLGTELGEDY
jgi:conjugal transfer pilus assembly protein TraF